MLSIREEAAPHRVVLSDGDVGVGSGFSHGKNGREWTPGKSAPPHMSGVLGSPVTGAMGGSASHGPQASSQPGAVS